MFPLPRVCISCALLFVLFGCKRSSPSHSAEVENSKPAIKTAVEESELEFLTRFTGLCLKSGSGDYPLIWNQTGSFPEDRQQIAQELLLQHWISVNPEEAVKFGRSHFAEFEGSLKHEFLKALGKHSTDAEIEFAAGLPKELREEAIGAVLGRMAARGDFKAIMEVEQRFKNDSGIQKAVTAVIQSALFHLVESDPAKAAAALQSLPHEKLPGTETIKDILLHWTRDAPDQALRWAESLPAGEARETALLRVNTMLGVMDPNRAVQQARNTSEGPMRVKLFKNVAMVLAKKGEPQRAFELMTSLPESKARNDLIWKLMEHAAERDPEITANVLATSSVADGMEMVCRGFTKEWLQADVPAVFQWFLSLPDGPLRKAVGDEIVEKATNYIPEEAAQYVAAMEDDAERAKIVMKLVEQHGEENPELSQQLAPLLSRPADQRVVEKTALENQARKAPLQALQAAMANPDQKERVDQISAVCGAWASKDPVAAARWIDTVPLPERALLDTDIVAATWAEVDVHQAEKWAAQLPARTREMAMVRVGEVIARTDPVRAFELVKSTTSEVNLAPQLSSIVRVWAYSSPQEAAEYVRASDLSPKVQERILKTLK